MKLSAVLAGCLVVACCCCAVNTQKYCQGDDNIVFVFDCLDNSNNEHLDTVKNYTKLIIQHMEEKDGGTLPHIGLLAVDGEADGRDLAIPLNSQFSQNKLELMAFIDRIKTNRREIKLEESIEKILTYEIFSADDQTKENNVVVFRDGSVPGGITTDHNDKLHTNLVKLPGKLLAILFYRLNNTVDDASVKDLSDWFKASCPKYTLLDFADRPLTAKNAFDTMDQIFCCTPVGKEDDPLWTVPTVVTLPPPPPTHPLPADSTTNSYAMSFTKTSLHGVVGLCMSVLIAAAAALSTF